MESHRIGEDPVSVEKDVYHLTPKELAELDVQ